MSSAREFLKTEAKLRALALRMVIVSQIDEDLHANKRTVKDLSDEELQMLVECTNDGVDVTKLTDEELEELIGENCSEGGSIE